MNDWNLGLSLIMLHDPEARSRKLIQNMLWILLFIRFRGSRSCVHICFKRGYKVATMLSDYIWNHLDNDVLCLIPCLGIALGLDTIDPIDCRMNILHNS